MKKMKLVNSGLLLLIVAGLTLVVPHAASADCPEDIVAYWKLNETTGAPYLDFLGNNDGAVATGKVAPLAATGIVGGAQEFTDATGVRTGIDVAADSAFNWAGSESFSIEFWMNTSATRADNQVVIGRYDDAINMQWWVGLNSAGQARFSLVSTTTPGTNINGTKVLSTGTWHHVVAVRDSVAGEIRIYVDGVSDATPVAGNFPAGFSSGSSALNIGWLNRTPFYHYSGLLDEVALYNRALTPTEIADHYTAGLAGIDYCSGGAAPIARYAPFPDDTIALWPLDEGAGSTTFVDLFGDSDLAVSTGKVAPSAGTGIVGGAQEFTDATGARTGIGVAADSVFNWAGNESFSIEFWMNTSATRTDNQVVIGRYDDALPMQWWVGLNSAGGARFSLVSTTTPGTNINGTTVLSTGTWRHVVAVRDSVANQIRIYVDGVSDATPVAGNFPAGFASGSSELTVGWLNRTPFYHYSGLLDEVALYNRALTPTEIADHYTAGLAGNGLASLRPAPVAVAVASPTPVKENKPATLDGSGSAPGYADAPISSYLWTQTGGPTVSSLTGASTVEATFTAPDFDSGNNTLTFSLTVTAEDGQPSSDTISVDVVALVAPQANAGLPQTVTAGDDVVLDGSGSSDADGTIVSYLWEQTEGTAVTLTDAATAGPTFTLGADAPAETLVFRLTVTDDDGLTGIATVAVTVSSGTPAPPPSGGGGGGGCFINTMF